MKPDGESTHRGTYTPPKNILPPPPPVRCNALLAAAQNLFKTGHKASPFMTLDSGPNGCSLTMRFQSLDDGQAVHSALVRFFTANPVFRVEAPCDSYPGKRCWASE